jgi:hypothetical protein
MHILEEFDHPDAGRLRAKLAAPVERGFAGTGRAARIPARPRFKE